MAPTTEGYAQVNDLKLYYQILGDQGDPLVMVMGLSFSHLDWGVILPQLLSQNYRVILLDNRDAGLSSTASQPYTMAEMADDIAGLLEALAIDRADVFGISMGGMIAQQFALKYPQKLSKLILGCTACSGSTLERVSETLAATSLTELLFTPAYIQANRQQLEDFLSRIYRYHSKPEGFMRQLGAIATHDVCQQLDQITASTLILTGDRDIVIPPKHSDVLSQALPNAKLIPPFLDAGHGFPYSHAQETADVVQQFLEE
ncbi:MAG: alpha/beta hydrolase [Leptolyngbya sp.]|nr:MAG: alpha/beta hydrolase [Leptolyngbya sp.]